MEPGRQFQGGDVVTYRGQPHAVIGSNRRWASVIHPDTLEVHYTVPHAHLKPRFAEAGSELHRMSESYRRIDEFAKAGAREIRGR